ncbi:hypothetical protein L596_003822 [Steinernema carpocapsae]|uniref:Uncharacterized protein n=1 Tax=Steinernema carpocapsae TaxID=34508 RepID=A0A4U8UTU6_STECR|nr:hypothetical protein L596_003822 [Steinernema carpocapsae]
MISLDEFLQDTEAQTPNKDEGWKDIGQEQIYTDEELRKFEEEYAKQQGWGDARRYTFECSSPATGTSSWPGSCPAPATAHSASRSRSATPASPRCPTPTCRQPTAPGCTGSSTSATTSPTAARSRAAAAATTAAECGRCLSRTEHATTAAATANSKSTTTPSIRPTESSLTAIQGATMIVVCTV